MLKFSLAYRAKSVILHEKRKGAFSLQPVAYVVMVVISIALLVKWSPADFTIFCIAFLDTERNRRRLGDNVQQLPSDSRRITAFLSEFNMAISVVKTTPSSDNECSYRPRLATTVRIRPNDASTFIDMLDVEGTEMTSDIADAHIVAVCPEIYVEDVSTRPPLA